MKQDRTKKEQSLVGERNAKLEGVVVAAADHTACLVVVLGTMDSFLDEVAEVVGEDLPFHPSTETADTIVAHMVGFP